MVETSQTLDEDNEVYHERIVRFPFSVIFSVSDVIICKLGYLKEYEYLDNNYKFISKRRIKSSV